MSIYRITDVTPVGAYMNAMKARHDGDRRDTAQNINNCRGPSICGYIGRIVGSFLAFLVSHLPRKPIRPAPAE